MTVPSSTYRLQLRPEFGFEDARAVIDYLDALGVGALYVSPVLDATPGSAHGYDVTDPRIARPALGGERPGSQLADALRAAGMGLVVDIVPNHMSIEVPSANPFWWDVLAKGPGSQFAHWFDIDWSRGRILVPVLGSAADVAELAVDGDELVYFDHRFPIAGSTRRHCAGGPRPPALRARRLAARQHRAQLSALLRHHDPRGGVGRAPRRLRRRARRGAALGGRRRRHRAAGGPPGRARRPHLVPAVAAGSRAGRLDRRREDPASGRGAPTDLARGRHDRL